MITGGSGLAFSFVQELTLHFAALFCLCMVCHGELVRLRPDPRYLTSFYLLIAAGGRLGGLLVSLVAPQMFSTFFEWRLGLVIGCLMAAWVLLEGQSAIVFSPPVCPGGRGGAADLCRAELRAAFQAGGGACVDVGRGISLASFRSSSGNVG